MTQDQAIAPQRTDFDLWIETVVVVVVCVMPAIFNSMASIYFVDSPSQINNPVLYHSLSTLINSSAEIAFIGFIIWKSKEPLRLFGLRPFRILPDLLGGIALWAVMSVASHFFWRGLASLIGRQDYLALVAHFYHLDRGTPVNMGEYVLLGIYCLANGWREELVMRAYLIPRFERLLQSTPVALLLTTVLFASYHGYQGSMGVISELLLGLIFGAAFCVFRRIWPIALAHAIFDFAAVAHFPRFF